MDSEQLVSRPYHDLQMDSQTDMQKKSSAIEKVTNVKNNICDRHLHVLEGKLHREETSLIKNLNNATNKLRYEVKRLDVDKQNNELDIKKRVDPEKDYSYDESQLNKSCTRLGANGSAFYLQKNLRFPVRHKIVAHRVPLDVQHAQDLLRRRRYNRGGGDRLVCSAPSMNLEGRSAGEEMRGGRKSDVWGVHDEVKGREIGDREEIGDEKGLMKENEANQYLKDKLPSLQQGQSPSSRLSKSSCNQLVKFANDPGNRRHSLKMARARTFHGNPGENEEISGRSNTSEKVDIVAALMEKFPDSLHLQRPVTEHRNVARRKSTVAPRVTQKLMKRDSKIIQSKIDQFYSTVFHVDPKMKEVPEVEAEFSRNKRRGSELLGMTGLMGLYGKVLEQTAAAIKDTNAEHDSMEFQAWLEIGRKELDEHKRLKREAEMLLNDGKEEDTDSITEEQVAKNDKLMEKLALKKWRELSWRLTKEGISKEYNADISINRLMGIDVMGDNKRKINGIPVNSAGRALRQSTSYKMQKLLDKLTRSKNKFEQLEVNELKRRLEEGETIDSLNQAMDLNQTDDRQLEGELSQDRV